MLRSSLSPLERSPPLIPAPARHRWIPTALHRRSLLVAASLITSHGGGAVAGIRPDVRGRALHALRPPLFTATSAPGSTSTCTGSKVGLRSPGLELGLLSLALVFSMIAMSFFTVALVSLPAMGVSQFATSLHLPMLGLLFHPPSLPLVGSGAGLGGFGGWCQALKKLSTAMEKLSNVVAREVPGTLLSMKLSAREIDDMTQQLSSLRRIISGNRGSGKEDRIKRRSKRCGDDPLLVDFTVVCHTLPLVFKAGEKFM
ncbi:hypothetical protein Taro_004167 [Colocasia esculenta]|uniref:Uncharacterized protein n=1 Tax=Colocasia esculenta TaxID=4460 RepID=A0A843TQX4_COLES|nr:hypothetical protein [Colocasia esculenta]